ncbi:uncharacterized protein LOC122057710 isoform X2 [Macadamia integrifolia]|uniref:uncharacterized protein LOC122057710 isoform X2 n=1 Tax=Macadamia integrifolia TaxID=60698 RepID=UPI001C531AAB|nr:uncharacterized protein LOC122057710 isoform X2 [Macadamia integrifolia]
MGQALCKLFDILVDIPTCLAADRGKQISKVQSMMSRVPGCVIATCEVCGKECSIFTSNSRSHFGRKYFKCPMNCPFFMWVDHFRICKCGKGQCKVRIVKTNANYGRYFWCCPQSSRVGSQGYRMIAWIPNSSTSSNIDQTPPWTQCSETSTSSSPSPSTDYIK